MTALRLALVRQRYADDGGAERFVARLLGALSGRDIRMTLITRRWTGSSDFDVVTMNPFYIGRWWRDWSFARAVSLLLREDRFDLVQSHERIAGCDIYRAGDGVHREWLAQSARARSPIGRVALKLSPYHRYVCAAERRLFASPRLRAIVCNSLMVKDEIKRHFGCPDRILRVIYTGVDTASYHPDLKRHRAEVRVRHGIDVEATLFLFVGSGFARKGLGATLKALSAVADVQLLIVGRDRRLSRFRRQARTLGIAERVHFVGAQSDVKPYYGAADALVLPTLYDPFPNVVLEAMASGLPVVTSRKCGAAEIIVDGESGFVCDALDAPALTSALTRLCARERRAAMAVAARRVAEAFPIGRMTDEYVRLYRECL